MSAALYLLVTVAIMHAVRGFSPGNVTPGAGAALSLGFILLSAYFAGELVARLGLPRLTGYLICGLGAGPYGLGYMLPGDVEQLHVFTSIAVALISLAAGAELSFAQMRPLARPILAMAGAATACTSLALTCALWLMRPWLPYLSGQSSLGALAISATIAVVLTAQSPAVALALRTELKAEGVVSRTVLGLVVIGDVVTIVLFSAAATLALAVLGGETDLTSVGTRLLSELLGSLLMGALLGGVLVAFLRTASRGVALFVVAFCLVLGEVARTLDLEPVLVGLAAGAVVRNLSAQSGALHGAIQECQLPVYVVFFAVAGASIHVDAVFGALLPAVFLVLSRAAGLLLGSRLGARLARAPQAVLRFAGFGMLPQAGLAIALAMSFARTLPQLGGAGALVLGVVALNELVAPALYRYALLRAGEGSQQKPGESPVSQPLPLPSPT